VIHRKLAHVVSASPAAGVPQDLEDKEMADDAAAASAPSQLANGSAQAGSAACENRQAAEGTAGDAAGAGSAAEEEAHANGGSPRTQLGGSFVFVSDGGSSKEDDLYGDSNPGGGSAALQLSPAGAHPYELQGQVSNPLLEQDCYME